MSIARDVSLRHITGPQTASSTTRPIIPLALQVFLVIQAIAWTVVPPFFYLTPHSSTLEIALWSRDWYLVNYQHPALAGWLLQGAYFLFGEHFWVGFLMAQICVAGTYLFVFLLGRAMLGAERGLFGTLIIAVVSYFNIAALKYNENMVQMPLWAAFCFGLWRASQSGRWTWWLFTAVVAALGVYGKFSMLMIIAFGACWVLLDPSARRCLRSAPLYLAIGLFLLLLSPLAVALIETHFGAVKWIASESSNRGISVTSMATREGKTVLLVLTVALVTLLISLFRPARNSPPAQSPTSRPVFAYLALMGGGPLLLTLTIGLFMPVRSEWASPMYSLVGLLIAAALPGLRGSVLARGALIASAFVFSLGALTLDSFGTYQDRLDTKVLRRDVWPGAAISQRFEEVWHKKIGMPLRIVGGDVWIAGLAGFYSADRPSLYPELNLAMWPGGSEERVVHDGVLVLWMPRVKFQPSAEMLQRYTHGKELFHWSKDPDAKPLEIDYLIIPPAGWVPTI